MAGGLGGKVFWFISKKETNALKLLLLYKILLELVTCAINGKYGLNAANIVAKAQEIINLNKTKNEKIYVIAVLMMAFIFSANAQIDYGIKGGFHLTTSNAINESMVILCPHMDSKNEFSAGVWARFKILVVGLYPVTRIVLQ